MLVLVPSNQAAAHVASTIFVLCVERPLFLIQRVLIVRALLLLLTRRVTAGQHSTRLAPPCFAAPPSHCPWPSGASAPREERSRAIAASLREAVRAATYVYIRRSLTLCIASTYHLIPDCALMKTGSASNWGSSVHTQHFVPVAALMVPIPFEDGIDTNSFARADPMRGPLCFCRAPPPCPPSRPWPPAP